MPPMSRRDALKGVVVSIGGLVTAGCTALDGSTDGSLELINLSSESVYFTVSAESTEKPDNQQTPMFRTQYYATPEKGVILPNALTGDEYRVSILVDEETAGDPGSTLASGQTTFAPSTQKPTLYVRYDFQSNESVTFDAGQ
ncbi:hypothetical protein GJ631_16220 [Natronomonas sp. CBA1123]|uniref:hypothetical protein n=1 Tax=Natronomonas sp. CBA1123 TaxID=2668070 RepID=UPI0012E9AECA|nr:hypothetical protein [Natronomonas sp. CBA1123]MUV88055.1 hypothetical protein [Natronomonas sp. CBA1123]